MTSWRQHRQMLISFTFAGVFLTLGKFSLDPNAGNRPVKPFAFAEVIPLPGWQLLKSHSLVEPVASLPSSKWDSVLASQKYYYKQNNQQMEIEMRYVVGTLGDLYGYFTELSSMRLQKAQLLQLRQQEGVGFYSVFVYQGRSHLSACINPRGSSTVTSAQFATNRHTHDLQLQRLVPWLLGKESLQDRRCLWVHLSTPLNQVSTETTYSVLEKAWLPWYQWWSGHFPQH